jgi:type II restriction enzyme
MYMSSSERLRINKNQHTVKNSLSKAMDKNIAIAIRKVILLLQDEFPELTFTHISKMMLTEIISGMGVRFPQYKDSISAVMGTSFIKPDGGFLYAIDKSGNKRLILVAEVKRQGTNDKRLIEGLKKQAKGNAIERLGKNLIGVRALFKEESLIPFICFGSGDDFQPGSSILDRVITMNDYFPLNKVFVKKEYLPFEPVTMLFRIKQWSVQEMVEAMLMISRLSIRHYFS